MAMTHSEDRSSSEKEDQRSVREGFLEEMALKLGLEGKGAVRLVERWR